MTPKPDPDLALVRVSNRDWGIWDNFVRGLSPRAIGESHGLSAQQVNAILKNIKKAIPQEDLDLVRYKHLAELQNAARGMWDLFQKNGTPVTAGNKGDVVYDPDTGEIVRDYSLRLQATDRLLKIQERHAKLLGLDAAVKVDAKVEVNHSESIDGELAVLAQQLGLTAPVAAEAERLDENE